MAINCFAGEKPCHGRLDRHRGGFLDGIPGSILKEDQLRGLCDGINTPGEDMPWDFTWDRWSPGTYIWKNGNIVVLSSLIAANPGNGSLRLLWDGLTEAGYEIQVPTPFPVVCGFLERRGWGPTVFHDPQTDQVVELWVKE